MDDYANAEKEGGWPYGDAKMFTIARVDKQYVTGRRESCKSNLHDERRKRGGAEPRLKAKKGQKGSPERFA